MRIVLLACLLCLSSILLAENYGSCPGAPSLEKPKGPAQQHDPPFPQAQHAGDAMLQVVVSDTGYPCSVRVLSGLDKEADEQAVAAVKKWRFAPARKDGKPVPVVIVMQISFWRGNDGTLVMESLKRQKQAESPASRSAAPALDHPK
jgi:TonB family protein